MTFSNITCRKYRLKLSLFHQKFEFYQHYFTSFDFLGLIENTKTWYLDLIFLLTFTFSRHLNAICRFFAYKPNQLIFSSSKPENRPYIKNVQHISFIGFLSTGYIYISCWEHKWELVLNKLCIIFTFV